MPMAVYATQVSRCTNIFLSVSFQTKLCGGGALVEGGWRGEPWVVMGDLGGSGGPGWWWGAQVGVEHQSGGMGQSILVKVKMQPGTRQVLVNTCWMCLVSWGLFLHYTSSSLSISPALQDDSFQKQPRPPTCSSSSTWSPHLSLQETSRPVPSSTSDRGWIFIHVPKVLATCFSQFY